MAGTLGWFGLTLSFVLFSCVPIQLQLHEDDLKLIVSDPIIYVVTFKPPPFEVDTSTNVALIGGVLGGAGGAVGGAVGAAVAGAVTDAAAGANPTAIQRDPRALLRFTTYEDPVKQVRDDFVKTVQDELKLSRVIVVEEALEDESPKALSDILSFHSSIAASVGRTSARNKLLTSFEASGLLVSTHQFSTRMKVAATYWTRRSGGIWPGVFPRP